MNQLLSLLTFVGKTLLVLSVLAFLHGCKSGGSQSSEVLTAEQFVYDDERVDTGAGSYSWWVSPMAVNHDGKVYFTGISPNGGGRGAQWVTAFNSTIDEADRRVLSKDRFLDDEHNAPAIIKISTGLLVAYTGHNYLNNNGKGAVYVRQLSGELITGVEQEILFPDAVSYAQLVHLNAQCLGLFSRLRSGVWMSSTSCDNGSNWTQPRPLLKHLSKPYILANGNGEKVSFFVSQHPSTSQGGRLNYAELPTQSLLSEEAVSVLTQESKRDLHQSPSQYRVRLLDSYAQETKVGLFAQFENSLMSTSHNEWQLGLAWNHSGTWWSAILDEVFVGTTGDKEQAHSSYVLGASIADKDSIEATYPMVTLLVTSLVDDEYRLEELKVDLTNSSIEQRRTLYTSQNRLSRPVDGGVAVMVQEIKRWNSYVDFDTKVLMIKK